MGGVRSATATEGGRGRREVSFFSLLCANRSRLEVQGTNWFHDNIQRGVYRVFITPQYWNALVVIAIKRVLFCLLLDYKKKLWNMERQDGRGDTKSSENISRVSAENNFSTQEDKFRISKRPCNVILIIKTPMKYQTISH